MSAAVNVFIADLPPSFKKGGWGWIFKIPLYPPFAKGEKRRFARAADGFDLLYLPFAKGDG